MHIAVCDDNIADRKQLERLLGRESEKRKTDTGVFYTDSFGDSEVLGKNPMPYDLFFLDMTSSEIDGLSFALQLRKASVTAPIVLCSSKIDYQAAMASHPDLCADFMYLSKPIALAQLRAVLDRAISMQQSRIPTIELRSEKDTYYVKEDDIVHVMADGLYIHVTLKDGSKIPVLTDMYNFYYGLELFTHLVLLTDKAMINIIYLEKYTPFHVILKDGTVIKSSPFAMKYIKSALRDYRAEQP